MNHHSFKLFGEPCKALTVASGGTFEAGRLKPLLSGQSAHSLSVVRYFWRKTRVWKNVTKDAPLSFVFVYLS